MKSDLWMIVCDDCVFHQKVRTIQGSALSLQFPGTVAEHFNYRESVLTLDTQMLTEKHESKYSLQALWHSWHVTGKMETWIESKHQSLQVDAYNKIKLRSCQPRSIQNTKAVFHWVRAWVMAETIIKVSFEYEKRDINIKFKILFSILQRNLLFWHSPYCLMTYFEMFWNI